MKNKNKIFLVLLITLIFFTGCSGSTDPINSNSTGFFSQYLVYPLSLLIKNIASFAGLGYGIAIIIATILVRTLMLPLMIKQTKSAKMTQAIQPEMKKLKDKYSSKDKNTQLQLQKEMSELYKKYGINPLAGCLPLLIQMPILIAFYQAIMRTEEIANHSFLWFDLGLKDPYYILPVIAAITTFIQQKMSMAGQSGDSPASQQMKVMTYLMPIMILTFAIRFPSALSLYWVIGNLYGIGQTYFIKIPDIEKNVVKEDA